MPAAYRGYPFVLAKTDEDRQVLCIDEDSGLVIEQPSPDEGEPFFNSVDQPAAPVRQELAFLQQVAANRQQTASLCALLTEHGLIQPWPLQVNSADGERPVEGLYRIDEAVLNRLSAEAFEPIRQAVALHLIFCQLLSMQHVAQLGKLAEAHAKAKPSFDAGAILGEQDTLSFDWETP